MKEYIKNATWVDWILMSIGACIVIGATLFIIGFFWSFEQSEILGPVGEVLGKTNVSKILKADNPFAGKLDLDNKNLFTLAGSIDPSLAPLFGLVVTSLVGFSLMMLGLLGIIILLIASLVVDYIIPKIKAKKNKS